MILQEGRFILNKEILLLNIRFFKFINIDFVKYVIVFLYIRKMNFFQYVLLVINYINVNLEKMELVKLKDKEKGKVKVEKKEEVKFDYY